MRKWGRKRSGSQARASALTAASALIGHTCKRPCVEHSMDMGKEDVVETFLPPLYAVYFQLVSLGHKQN